MKINIPESAKYILSTLIGNGYEAFVVGGCVRDSLLKKLPSDWDITTNAKPEAVIELFKHTIPTGLKHGTVTVIIDNIPYEVTTYRIEGDYSDSRHPDCVHFTDDITKDLKRRDFTINAMAYNEIIGLVDPFNGQLDLELHYIKCVGNASERFNEDALRMLRAIRFSCQLGFTIEKETYIAIVSNKHLIQKISIERINTEFCKILMSNFPAGGINNLNDTGLLDYFLPELKLNTDLEHIKACLALTPNELILRLSVLLHHIQNKNLSAALKRLKFDNLTIKNVLLIINEYANLDLTMNYVEVKRLIARMGKENLNTLMKLAYVDRDSCIGTSFHKSLIKTEQLNKFSSSVERIVALEEPIQISDLKITGNDLKALGYSEGKELGVILNKLLDLVLENPDLNTKDKLLEIAVNNF